MSSSPKSKHIFLNDKLWVSLSLIHVNDKKAYNVPLEPSKANHLAMSSFKQNFLERTANLWFLSLPCMEATTAFVLKSNGHCIIQRFLYPVSSGNLGQNDLELRKIRCKQPLYTNFNSVELNFATKFHTKLASLFRTLQFDWQLCNQIAKFVANFENTEQNPLVKSFVKCFVKVILSYNLFPKR